MNIEESWNFPEEKLIKKIQIPCEKQFKKKVYSYSRKKRARNYSK